MSWVKDRYIGSVSGARAHGSWVVGVYGAPAVDSAAQTLAALVAGVDALPDALPDDVVKRAAEAPQAEGLAAGATDEPEEPQTDYGDTESPSEYER